MPPNAELSDPLNREEKIGSIAYRCGSVSDSHFTHAFREAFGVRPTDIREAPPFAGTAGEPSLAAWLASPNFIRK